MYDGCMGSLLLAVIYLAFVSLGLPDSLLGSAWPQMRLSFGVPSSYAGYVSMTTSMITVLSAVSNPWLSRRVRTGKIIVYSILLTVIGLLGFSFADRYWMLFLFAVPYGLGAGSIDASLNNYVANHYNSSVMNLLHCFYGLGAIISPNVMALALRYARWNEGYRWTAFIQIGILLVCILSLPLWKKTGENTASEQRPKAGIAEAFRIPGVLPTLIAFYAYCAGENTCFLWTSSYFAGVYRDISPELVASFGSLVFGGLMAGRLISAFVSEKTGDRKLIRIGIGIELIGICIVRFSTAHYIPAAVGFLLIGMGMGPIYPSIMHMAPVNFGERSSNAVISLQMAAAYIGSTFMPMVFGLLQQAAGIAVMPYYLILFLILNIGFLELAYRSIKKTETR